MKLHALLSAELRWLARETRPFWKCYLGSFFCVTVAGLLSLIDPLVMKWLIDKVLPKRDLHLLGLAVALIFVAFQARAILTTAGTYLNFRVYQRFSLKLRNRILKHLYLLSADYHETTPTGAKVFLVNDTIQEIGTLGMDFVPIVLRTCISGLCTLGVMFALNVRLTLVILPIVPTFVFVNRLLRRRLHSCSETVQTERASMASVLYENVSSVLQSQLLRCGNRQLRQAHRAFARTVRAEHMRRWAEMRYTLILSGITVAAIMLVLGFGGLQVIRHMLSLGSLVAFYAYLMRLFEPLSTAVEMSSRLQRIGASIRRITAALKLTPSIKDSPLCRPLPQYPAGLIELRSASFSYRPGVRVIEELSLQIKGGERVAVVGPNGAGKSTLAKLIARVYDVESGSVCIAHRDVREIALSSLRTHVCYLPQHPVLFDCSLEENLLLGNPSAQIDELQRVGEIAELSQVIDRLPRGWQQPVGPGGYLLSGGERQRVALARILLQHPRILVLDEATSALDSYCERVVLGRLNRLLPDTSIVLITQGLSAITWVDRILVMENGRIVEAGTHTEVYRRHGLYTSLYDCQSAPTQSIT